MGCDSIAAEAHGSTALKAAVRRDDHSFVRHLLETRVDVDAPATSGDLKWSTSLQEAAGCRNLRLVQLLISFGADVNAFVGNTRGVTAIQIAASIGNTQLVGLHLNSRADANAAAGGTTALVEEPGSATGLAIVKMLLESGASMIGQWEKVFDAVVNPTDCGIGLSLELVHFLLGHRPVSEVIGTNQATKCIQLYRDTWHETEHADLN